MKIMMSALVLFQLVFLLAYAGAGSEAKGRAGDIDGVPEAEWKRLSNSRIFFGHQSVGNNIMAGVADVMRQRPYIRLNVRETAEPGAFSGPVFAHARVGHNEKPLSKNEAFREYLDGGIGGKADIAFYKYCYIDIKSRTDAAALFEEYKKNAAALKARHPSTRLVHVTVPLTVVQSGWKASVKRLLGKPVGGYGDNIRRNEFNELMRKEYGGREPIFDLAAIEASGPGERRQTFRAGGREYMSLAPEYASDGRHLNEKGRRRVAERLLLMLLGLSGEEG